MRAHTRTSIICAHARVRSRARAHFIFMHAYAHNKVIVTQEVLPRYRLAYAVKSKLMILLFPLFE